MSSEDEVIASLNELQSYKERVPPSALLRQFLKQSRETRLKNTEAVARYGALLLKHHRGSMSEDELWLVHEQVAMAAMDCGALPTALGLVRAVLRQFPDSMRARRLQGMMLEATGKLQDAEELYEAVIQQNNTNQEFAKRLVALAKTRGDLPRAIEVLVKYLQHFMNDPDAWAELGELYLQAGMYRQAAFAYEELLTLNVNSPTAYVRYADVLCTLGGAANLRTARAYYSRAVAASGGRYARALHGLLACAAQLAADKDASSQELAEAASEQLVRMYQEAAPDKVAALNEGLKQQGLLQS